MRDVSAIETLPIPEGVTVVVKARNVTVEGPRGKLTKNIGHVSMDVQVVSIVLHLHENRPGDTYSPSKLIGRMKLIRRSQVKRGEKSQVVFTVWHGARKHVACLRTIRSLVGNMITGVTKVRPSTALTTSC